MIPAHVAVAKNTSSAARIEPMLLITDHSRIKDWEALTQSLSNQSDVQGYCVSGWDRLIDCEDGATVTINI